ncbi:hypothetical protein GE09DRAFT_1047205 [Coniochaeta sp. 2T2.1]|nr:hypothetical protein GE09DRAFT_1047205 [Coniochaeta sp. 2T2.1]
MNSLSAIERSNPPPRRKSCQACIKAKRRCDLGQPACIRCTQRLIECRYTPNNTSTPPRSRLAATMDKRQSAASAEPISIPPSALHSQEELQPAATQTDWDKVISDLTSTTDPAAMDANFDFLDNDDMDIMQFIHDTPAGSGEDLASCTPAFTIQRPPSPQYNKVNFILQHPLKGDDLELALLPVRERWKASPLSYTIAHRMQYSIDMVKDAPRRMVMELQTPWCHPELYRDNMPTSMQDALASSALHLSKTPRNSTVILHSLQSRISTLISSPSPPHPSPLYPLSRTQSLLLYLLLLIFDTSPLSRTLADSLIPPLESAAVSLVGLFGHNPFNPNSTISHPPPPEVLPTYPMAETREFWKRWVLEESARRTYMTCFFVVQMYLLLKGDVPKKCDTRLHLCHFWTVSARLWGAGDAFEFALAWGEGRRFVVNNNTIKDVLNEARGDEIEDFGKMILTTMMGIDETKGWLHSVGGTL